MAKKDKMILTERLGPLTYVKESGERNGKNYIGRLVGEGSNFLKPTRNGRKYNLQLWENVESSPDFIESMETLTCFGEADHPETRADTSIKEIAVVLTKFEIRRQEGIVAVEFDILDTPNGRLVKSILDYGSKLGVSSRGLGDEIFVDGETLIDPETYEFYGFDVVVTPAVKSARPSLVESKTKTGLVESFNREIKEASSSNELESIRRLAETLKIPELDSIKESLNNKLSNLPAGDDISEGLKKDLEEVILENDQLLKENETLKSKLSANDIRVRKLEGKLKVTMVKGTKIQKNLQESQLTIVSLEDELVIGSEQMNELSGTSERKIKKLETRLASLSRIVKETKDGHEKIINELNSNYEDDVKEYLTEIDSLRIRVDRLKESKDNLKSQVKVLNDSLVKETSNKKLIEKKIHEKHSSEEEAIKKLLVTENTIKSKYLKVKCAQSGIKLDTATGLLPKEYTVEDIDKIVGDLADRKLRLGKLPVEIRPRTAILSEGLSNITPEEKQTMSFLTGKIL